MKKLTDYYRFRLCLLFLLAGCFTGVLAQEPEKQPEQRKRTVERMSPDESVPGLSSKGEQSLTEADRQAGRRELESEAEAEIQPYLNNYFNTLRFGPQDIVSVLVFNHEKYSMANITIPPDGRLNYPLIGPVLMVGRTAQEVEKEIADKLSEYIIEPKVTVQIVQARSLKYMVMGDVNKPGIFEMNRRLSVVEAILEAGDLTRYADRSKISVLRLRNDGSQQPYVVNMKEMQKGKGTAFFLSPGDVVVVPGNKFKTLERILQNVSLLGWMRTIIY